MVRLLCKHDEGTEMSDWNMTPTEVMLCDECARNVAEHGSYRWDSVRIAEHECDTDPRTCQECESALGTVEALAYNY